MKAKRLITTIPVLTALALGFTPALAGADVTQSAVSDNWAGYTVSGASFSSVSGSWVQPKVSCTSGDTYSAFWVGLGGSSEQSESLEQIGTQGDCSAGGSAGYYAWYELVPAGQVTIPMKIEPGDRISATVSVSGSSVTVSLKDQTSGASFTKTLTMQSPDSSSAEWIAEAPSACQGDGTSYCRTLALADFGTVRFSNATATAGGHTGTITDSSWTAQPVTLSAGASPSSPSAGGSSFSVSYRGGDYPSAGGYGYDSNSGYGGYGPGGYSGYGDYGYGDGGYGPGGHGPGGYSPGGYAGPGYGYPGYAYAY